VVLRIAPQAAKTTILFSGRSQRAWSQGRGSRSTDTPRIPGNLADKMPRYQPIFPARRLPAPSATYRGSCASHAGWVKLLRKGAKRQDRPPQAVATYRRNGLQLSAQCFRCALDLPRDRRLLKDRQLSPENALVLRETRQTPGRPAIESRAEQGCQQSIWEETCRTGRLRSSFRNRQALHTSSPWFRLR